jgi:aminoglycoside phosphotransferase (APT) family kinase protein
VVNKADTGSDAALPLSPAERDSIAAWLGRHGVGDGKIEDAELLSGGTQNIMLKIECGGGTYVLRRGPLHLRPDTNKHLRREGRILGGLAKTDVPHARLVAFCEDEDVWSGSCFYLMELVDGFNATVELPEPYQSSAASRHALGLAVIDALARLAAVDPHAVGLDSIGRPDGFLARQVPRWLDEYARYPGFAGYRQPPHPAVAVMGTWLSAHMPPDAAPGLMHGDFHLANLMFRRDVPEVAAIIDWEMATVADPLLDLGWLLAMWPENHQGQADGVLGVAGGLPHEDELVQRYTVRAGRPVEHLPWYTVLACLKLGVLLEGTYARSCAGLAPEETGLRLHATSTRLFEQGERRVRAMDQLMS